MGVDPIAKVIFLQKSTVVLLALTYAANWYDDLEDAFHEVAGHHMGPHLLVHFLAHKTDVVIEYVVHFLLPVLFAVLNSHLVVVIKDVHFSFIS